MSKVIDKLETMWLYQVKGKELPEHLMVSKDEFMEYQQWYLNWCDENERPRYVLDREYIHYPFMGVPVICEECL